MTDLRKTAKQAQRRLWLNRWFSKWGWSLTAAGVLFVLAVFIDRLWAITPAESRIPGFIGLGLLAASFLASVIWTLITRDTLPAAAAELDRAAGLKERISSGLFCEVSDDPFGQAVVADARRISRSLTVRRHLPLRVPYSANYAGATMVVALLFFWLFPTVDLAGNQQQRDKARQQQDQIQRTQALIQPVVKKEVEQLRQKYPNLKEDIDKLDPMKNATPATRPEDIRNEPIKRVNDLARKVEDKRENPDLAKIEQFQDLAKRLAARQTENSVVSRLAKAMAEGDYKSAQQALDEMKLELAKAPKTEQEKRQAEQLQKQLQKVASQLKQLADNDKKAQNELAKAGLTDKEIQRALEQLKKQDIESLKKDLAKKGLSEKQIDKLAQQLKKCQGACQMASKMAQNLSQASQGQKGEGQMSQSAQAGFSEASDQLSEMESMQQELNELTSAAADLKNMKDKLAGAGDRDGQNQGEGEGEGQGTDQGKMGQTQGGMGNLGIGQGGVAPKQEVAARTTPEKAKVHTVPGAIISTQFIDGEQIKGDVTPNYVEAVISAQRDVTDAISKEAIPRQYHAGLKKYFDHARDGLPADKVKAAESKLEAEKPNSDAK